jgi:hypothetical protein
LSHPIQSGYSLPFEVRYAPRLFAGPDPVQIVFRLRGDSTPTAPLLAEVTEAFVQLCRTGALSGETRGDPSSVSMVLPPFIAGHHVSFSLTGATMDDRALLPFTHMLLARAPELGLEALEVFPSGATPHLRLMTESDISTYPPRSPVLLFPCEDEEPESGAYTFTAEMVSALRPRNREDLSAALAAWTVAVMGGAYGLAPIPPQESYVEPSDTGIVAFDETLEWTVFKVRADPACIDGLVNIFATFHTRNQPLTQLVIS